MHEKFAEGWRAGTYVGNGILADFPEAVVEVALEVGGQRREFTSPAKDVGRVVSELCRGFPKASVYYHPESAIGFVSQVRCHCSHEKSADCCKANGQERARVLVVLKPPADQDTPEYRNAIAAEMKRDVVEHHQEQRAKRKRSSTHSRPHKNKKRKKKSIFGIFG